MSVEILNPFDSYRANSGVPLDAGKLYVGVANLDPITNPISVFYDEALTIAAPQPIPTSGGYGEMVRPHGFTLTFSEFSMSL